MYPMDGLLNRLFVCLFVLGVFVPLGNFSLICRLHHYRWRAAFLFVCLFVWSLSSHCKGLQILIYICSEPMAIKQWGFFSVSHLLWHGASVNNSNMGGPVTPNPIDCVSLAYMYLQSLKGTSGKMVYFVALVSVIQTYHRPWTPRRTSGWFVEKKI